MPLIRKVAPVKEPLAIDEAIDWARVNVARDEALVGRLIKAVRAHAEARTRRSLITQTWRLTLDAFPGPSMFGVPRGVPYSLPGHAIILERPPIRSITQIQYLAMDGTTQTMPTTDYVDLTLGGTLVNDDPVRITPVFGKIWPIPLPQIGSVWVDYVTGYGADASSIPEDLKAWMQMRVAMLFENRESVVVGERIVVAELPTIDSMLDPYTVELF
jgi:uncharacterized phiE125 gp8 family phage protein